MEDCNSTVSPRQRGHTIIELMIVVMIIGILAAVSLAIYGVYTTRAHVVEGLAMVSRHKMAVFEYYSSQHHWPANNEAAGLPPGSAFEMNAINSITVLPDGIIEISYNEMAGNGTLELAAERHQNDIVWNCQGGTLPKIYRPQKCR